MSEKNCRIGRFVDRRVIVTGAGSGIGRATVARLLDEGATIVGCDVSADGLARTEAAARHNGITERVLYDTADERCHT